MRINNSIKSIMIQNKVYIPLLRKQLKLVFAGVADCE